MKKNVPSKYNLIDQKHTFSSSVTTVTLWSYEMQEEKEEGESDDRDSTTIYRLYVYIELPT
jgi:hypothetical protein